MGPSRDDRGSVEVSLTEHDDVGADDHVVTDRGGAPRRWWPVGAAIILVALVATGATVLEDRRESARRAQLAMIPGVLAPLDQPLQELWRTQVGGELHAAEGVGVFSDAGGRTLRGLDLADGDLRWSRDLGADEECQPVLDGGGGDDPPRIACQTALVAQAGASPDQAHAVVLLDVATGAPVAELEISGYVVAAGGYGTDLLVASVGRTGGILLERWEPGTGRRVWAQPAAEDFFGGSRDVTSVYRVIDELLWWGAPGTTPLDVRTGEVVPDAAPSVPGGGTLVEIRDDDRVVGSRVLDADGTLLFDSPAVPWAPPVSDGSAPEVITVRRVETGPLLSTGEVIGIDARTGELRWTGGVLAGVSPRVQVDGVLVAVGSGRVVAIDVATGEVRWEQGAHLPPYIGSMTDGDVLLVPQRDAGSGPVLAAHDIRSGQVRWTVEIPQESAYAGLIGDKVLVVTGDGLAIVLG